MKSFEELTALRDSDAALDLAMDAARENAIDLGLEYEEEEAMVAAQVNGWMEAGREW